MTNELEEDSAKKIEWEDTAPLSAVYMEAVVPASMCVPPAACVDGIQHKHLNPGSGECYGGRWLLGGDVTSEEEVASCSEHACSFTMEIIQDIDAAKYGTLEDLYIFYDTHRSPWK